MHSLIIYFCFVNRYHYISNKDKEKNIKKYQKNYRLMKKF